MSRSIARTLKTHWLALALALLAAVFVAAPQIAFRTLHAHDGVYHGIELLPDSPWAPRVREIMDGHGFGSIYYAEGKNDPYLFQPAGSMTVAYLGEASGLNINDTLLLSRLVLTPLVFLAIYTFVFLLSADALIAAGAASVLLLADSLLAGSGVRLLLHGVSPDSFLQIARPVNPAMVYLLLFGFLSAFWLFYSRRDWRLGALAALLLGASFYNYFYSWTYLYAAGGLLVLILLARGAWREAVRVGSIFVLALPLAIPYAINLYRAMQFSDYAEVSPRFGVVMTHAPLWIGFVAAGTIGALLLARRFAGFCAEERERYSFILALALAPLLTMNQQLVTGKVLQANHYHWYFHKPLAVIIALLILAALALRWRAPRARLVLGVLLIAGAFATGLFIQVYSYVYDTRDGGQVALERQAWGPAMDWLNANAHTDEVVLAGDEPSHLVTIYTPLNVFYHRAAVYQLSATRERLLDVLLTFYRLRGVSAGQAHDVFYAERGSISANVDGIHWREAAGAYEAIPDAELDDIVARYKATLATPTSAWLAGMLEKYRVGYVLWDTVADPSWQLERYPFLHKEVEFGTLRVYRVS